MKINKIITFCLAIFLWTACDNSNSTSSDSKPNSSWIFVANEGIMDQSNGSISMIDDVGNVYETDTIGDVVQSLEVYKDKLIVIINNDHKIILYDITEADGIKLPGVTVSTGNSNPREMVIIDDNIYFTNWETQDVKILNLQNNQLEELAISINGRPENIIYDGTYIWVSIPEISKWDGNQGTEVAKIDPGTNQVEYLEVGRGPQALLVHNNEIFISRTFYDENWNTYHGSTKIIGTGTIENTYGSGAPCGGSMMSYENKIYRSQNWIPSGEEGIVPLDDELNFIATGRIGNYQSPSIIYHMENINGQIYITITDYGSTNLVKVLDNYGNEIASYTAGIMPGDLAYWKKSE